MKVGSSERASFSGQTLSQNTLRILNLRFQRTISGLDLFYFLKNKGSSQFQRTIAQNDQYDLRMILR